MTGAKYTFLSWMRLGAAGLIGDSRGSDATLSTAPVRASLDVTLKLAGASEVTKKAVLLGPGDVTGFDTRQVVRTDPRPGVRTFEPNYFPCIDFDRPDLPWLFSPQPSDGSAVLRPWICLVVLPREAVKLKRQADGAATVLTCRVADLPDLSHAAWWAHVQIADAVGSDSVLENIVSNEPRKTVSRLIAPRILEDATEYVACVVPTFEAGRRAALGLGGEVATLLPAWSHDSSVRGVAGPADEVELPVFYSWSFATGPEGDLKSLLRRLRPWAPSAQLGIARMDLRPSQLPGADAAGLQSFSGALVGPGTRVPSWQREAEEPSLKAFKKALEERLEQGDPLMVAPPVYGSWHAAAKNLKSAPAWLRAINLDPRLRAAAGLGARVVQANQEAMMAAAWEQLDAVEQANRLLRVAQLARGICKAVYGKRIVPLGTKAPDLLLQLTAPAHGRLLGTDGARVLRREIAASRLPQTLLSGAFRRAARPLSPVAKRLGTRGNELAAVLRSRQGVLTQRAGSSGVRAPRGMVSTDQLGSKLRIQMPDISNLDTSRLLTARKTIKGIEPSPVKLFTQGTTNVVGVRTVASKVTLPGATTRMILPTAPVVTGVPSGGLTRPIEVQPVTSPTVIEREQGLAFIDATVELDKVLSWVRKPAATPAAKELRVDAVGAHLVKVLNPDGVARKIIESLISIPAGQPRPATDPLEPVMAGPVFEDALYDDLAALAPEFLVPGIGTMPSDSVTLLESNPSFVRAFLLGANVELGRELLWHGYPTDQRGTYFSRFWNRRPGDERQDIGPIHRWGAPGDDGAAVGSGLLTLVLRGEIVRRYPHLMLSMQAARWQGTSRALNESVRYEPVFSGRLGEDVLFCGFEVDAEMARGSTDPNAKKPGCFLVLSAQPTEPRFGLEFGAHFDIAHPRAHAADAAAVALTLLQRPVRVAIHADALLPEKR